MGYQEMESSRKERLTILGFQEMRFQEIGVQEILGNLGDGDITI